MNMVRRTVCNMQQAGELVRVGQMPRPVGSPLGRLSGVYAPAPEAAPSAAAAAAALALAGVLTGWGSARPAPTDAAPDGPQPPDELAP